MTLAQALAKSPAPPDVLGNQILLRIPFVGFDGQTHVGELVVHISLATEVSEIFRQILLACFPIEHMIPVVAFDWSDDDSMQANNCSAFNYRVKVGKTQLSAHATGRAIDINPRQNPYINGELILPAGAIYDQSAGGTLTPDCAAVQIFESFGWTWGGRWTSIRDYHHFEKPQLSP